MAREYTFDTHLFWHDGAGNECDCEATVTYEADPGFKGDRINPPEPASVEITKVVDSYGESLPDRFLEDEDLMAECLDDWAAEKIAAEEAKADQARSDRMMERF